MPAINLLLPVVSPQAVKKEGTQSPDTELKIAPVKETPKPENKGLEQDRQELKANEKRRFDDALEQELNDQLQAADQTTERRRTDTTLPSEPMSGLAASGNALPSTGESLPSVLGESAANSAAFKGVEQVLISTKLATDSAHSTTSGSDPAQIQSSSLAIDGAQEAVLFTNEDKSGSLVSLPQATSTLVGANVDQSVETMDEAVSEKSSEAQSLVQAADATALSQDAVVLPEDGDSAQNLTQSQSNSATLTQSQQAAANQSAADEARPIDQAERVRAWRGLSGQELQTSTTQSTRQDPIVIQSNLDQSGQLQQFAQSLRLALKQGDGGSAAPGNERGTLAANGSSTSAESLTSWRTDTAQPHLSSAARNGTNATSFAQTMQASNFGQALGEKVGQNAWGERIAQRVALMAGQKISSVQIQLDPPELGAMTVKVTVTGDQASVSFQSPHAIVRDALEQSFPRLQEMLGQQGIALADAQVSDQSSAQQDARSSSRGGVGLNDGLVADEDGVLGSMQTVYAAKGLIDYYA